MLTWSLIFILAVILTVLGSEWFNATANKLGERSHTSPFVRGVLISSFLVALPELVISITATAKGYSSMVPTYVTGANLINLLLIPGILALSCRGVKVQKEALVRQIPLLFSSIILYLLLSLDGEIALWEGAILLLAFLFFAAARHSEYKQGLWEYIEHLLPFKGNKGSVLILLVALIALGGGAILTVEGLSTIADIKAINPGYLASTIVALAVSFPEILFAYQTGKKGNADLAINVLITSSIVNSTLIVAIPSFIKPLSVLNDTASIGNLFLLVALILFSLSLSQKKWSLHEGAFLVLLYSIYLVQFLNPLFS